MSQSNKSVLKIIEEIKSKSLAKDLLIERIKTLGSEGSKFLAEELVPLIDEFDDKDVIFQFREMLAKLGITGDFLNSQGIKEEDANNIDEAIRKYELAVKLDPQYRWAYYNLGRMYGDKKGDNEKAVGYYQKAVSIYKHYGDAWNNLGNVYSRLSQLTRSKEAYETANNCPGYKYKHYPTYNLGLIYEKVGDNKKALEYFLKSVEIKGDYAKAIYHTGRMYKILAEEDKAYEFFAKAMKADKTYEEDIRNLGVIVEEIYTLQLIKELDNMEPVGLPGKEKIGKSRGKHGVRRS